MKPRKPKAPPLHRGLGLDKQCSMCDEEIYYNYSGPFEGVCGRCTDRIIARHRRTSPGRTVVTERAGRGGRFGMLVLVFLAGAAAAILLRPYLPL